MVVVKTDPQRAIRMMQAAAERWHGTGRPAAAGAAGRGPERHLVQSLERLGYRVSLQPVAA